MILFEAPPKEGGHPSADQSHRRAAGTLVPPLRRWGWLHGTFRWWGRFRFIIMLIVMFQHHEMHRFLTNYSPSPSLCYSGWLHSTCLYTPALELKGGSGKFAMCPTVNCQLGSTGMSKWISFVSSALLQATGKKVAQHFKGNMISASFAVGAPGTVLVAPPPQVSARY